MGAGAAGDPHLGALLNCAATDPPCEGLQTPRPTSGTGPARARPLVPGPGLGRLGPRAGRRGGGRVGGPASFNALTKPHLQVNAAAHSPLPSPGALCPAAPAPRARWPRKC